MRPGDTSGVGRAGSRSLQTGLPVRIADLDLGEAFATMERADTLTR